MNWKHYLIIAIILIWIVIPLFGIVSNILDSDIPDEAQVGNVILDSASNIKLFDTSSTNGYWTYNDEATGQYQGRSQISANATIFLDTSQIKWDNDKSFSVPVEKAIQNAVKNSTGDSEKGCVITIDFYDENDKEVFTAWDIYTFSGDKFNEFNDSGINLKIDNNTLKITFNETLVSDHYVEKGDVGTSDVIDKVSYAKLRILLQPDTVINSSDSNYYCYYITTSQIDV